MAAKSSAETLHTTGASYGHLLVRHQLFSETNEVVYVKLSKSTPESASQELTFTPKGMWPGSCNPFRKLVFVCSLKKNGLVHFKFCALLQITKLQKQSYPGSQFGISVLFGMDELCTSNLVQTLTTDKCYLKPSTPHGRSGCK